MRVTKKKKTIAHPLHKKLHFWHPQYVEIYHCLSLILYVSYIMHVYAIWICLNVFFFKKEIGLYSIWIFFKINWYSSVCKNKRVFFLQKCWLIKEFKKCILHCIKPTEIIPCKKKKKKERLLRVSNSLKLSLLPLKWIQRFCIKRWILYPELP